MAFYFQGQRPYFISKSTCPSEHVVSQSDTFKDPVMLKRLQQINNLPDADKHCILYAIDILLASATTRIAYGK
jgi:hypothetical protein